MNCENLDKQYADTQLSKLSDEQSQCSSATTGAGGEANFMEVGGFHSLKVKLEFWSS